MSKKAFFISLIVYTLLFVVVPLGYVLAQFYVYLLDGWSITAKFGNACIWLMVAFCGYLVAAMIYDTHHKDWK